MSAMWAFQLKIKLIFAVFVLVHGAVGYGNDVSNALGILKSRADRVINDFNNLKREINMNLDRQVNNLKINNMESINNVVNSATDRIRKEVVDAKQEGRNVDHCLEEARVALREYSASGFANLNKCDTAAHSLVKHSISAVETPLVQAANQIKYEADQIALSCIGSSGMMGYQFCVTGKMIPVANSVANLESTYGTVQQSIRSSSSSAITESYSCFSDAQKPIVADDPKCPLPEEPRKKCL